MAKYEVVYYPEEYNERMAEWCIVEWSESTNGVRIGKTISKHFNETDANKAFEDFKKNLTK